jgi:hypothetical protein
MVLIQHAIGLLQNNSIFLAASIHFLNMGVMNDHLRQAFSRSDELEASAPIRCISCVDIDIDDLFRSAGLRFVIPRKSAHA